MSKFSFSVVNGSFSEKYSLGAPVGGGPRNEIFSVTMILTAQSNSPIITIIITKDDKNGIDGKSVTFADQ